MKNNTRTLEFIRQNIGVSGVYAIVCEGTWRSYVGSSVNIGREIEGYFCMLRNNRHRNKELQRDFNEFGQDSVYCEVLEVTKDHTKCIPREHYWIGQGCNLYNSYKSFKYIDTTCKAIKNFWDKIECRTDDECWLCKKTSNQNEYRNIGFNGETFPAHRVAYFLTNPEIDQNCLIRHTCSNKQCCNPNHLISGSHYDNAKDRCFQGEIEFKGSFEIANWIRNEYMKNQSLKNKDLVVLVKNEFDIDFHPVYISSIILNKVWVDDNYNGVREYNSENHCNAKLDWNTVNKARQYYLENEDSTKTDTYNIFVEMYEINVSKQEFMLILENRLFKDQNYNPPTKDYFVRGEDTYNSILTWDIVREIRKLGNEGYSSSQITIFINKKHNLNIKSRYVCEINNNSVWFDQEYIRDTSKRAYKFWLEEEKIKLQTLRCNHTVKELSSILNRSVSSIKRQLQKNIVEI